MSLSQEFLNYESELKLIKQENEDLKRRLTFLEELIPAVLKKESRVRDIELFTVSEVAEKLKTNKNAVYELINKGYIKGLKLGSIKVPIDELESFIERNKNIDML